MTSASNNSDHAQNFAGLAAADFGSGRRVVVICVNGILTNPGDAEGWTDRAVTWLHTRTAVRAEKFEYASGALTRRLFHGQERRAASLVKMARYYIAAGYELVFVGHSNGCDLIERVLAALAEATIAARIRSVHLFAAASDGRELVQALAEERLGRAYLYGSASDGALQLARWSRRVLGPLGLGYGDLGRRVDDFAHAHAALPILAERDDAQGHRTWFERGENFERTLRTIAAHEGFLTEHATFLSRHD